MKKSRLIILGGFTGAGKTTIANKLATDYNFPFFNPDDFNAALAPILNKSFHEVSPSAYDVMWFVLKRNLKMGVTCVMDANMCHPYTWKTLDQVKKELSVDVIPIILECSIETHKLRVEKRGMEDKEHFNLGGDNFDDILNKYEFIKSLSRDDIVRVNAENSIEEVYESVLDALKLNKNTNN